MAWWAPAGQLSSTKLNPSAVRIPTLIPLACIAKVGSFKALDVRSLSRHGCGKASVPVQLFLNLSCLCLDKVISLCDGGGVMCSEREQLNFTNNIPE